jgi:outer membrane protein assembly factor BamB
VLWTYDLRTQGRSGFDALPGTDGTRVFFESGPVAIVALDPASGREIWRTLLTSGGGAANLVVRDGRVFVPEQLSVTALDAATGRILWTAATDSIQGAEAAADGDAIYVGERGGGVRAFAVGTGAPLWATNFGEAWPYWSTVRGLVVSGDTVYAAGLRYLNPLGGLKSGVIVALARGTGKVLWRYETPENQADVIAAPALADSVLIASNLYGGSIFAVNRFTAARAWVVPGLPTGFGPSHAASILGRVAYLGSNDGYAYALDVATGRVLWARGLGSSIESQAVCGGKLFLNDLLAIVALDLANGRQVGAKAMRDPNDVFVTGFAVAGGRAIVASEFKVFAFRC